MRKLARSLAFLAGCALAALPADAGPATSPATAPATRPAVVGWSNYECTVRPVYAVQAEAADSIATAPQSRPFDDKDAGRGGSYVQLIAYHKPVGSDDKPLAELEVHRVSRDGLSSRRLASFVVPFDDLGEYRPETDGPVDPVAVDDTLVYVSGKGLTVVGARGVETYDAAAGTPERIFHLATAGGRVFVAGPGVLTEFDPAAGRFRTLAATGSADPRSPLDAASDRRFYVEGLRADPGGGAIWASISNCPPVAHGIWRYDLAAGRFDHAMSPQHGKAPAGFLGFSPDGRLLVWGRDAYEYEVDPRTLLIRPFRPATDRDRRLYQLPDPSDAVEIGDDLIGGGWLIGPDGEPRHLKRVGDAVFNIPELFQIRHLRLNADGRGFVGVFCGPGTGYPLLEITRKTPDPQP